MTSSIGKYALTYSGSPVYTLTTSLVASDVLAVKFSKLANIFSYYTPGAGGTGNSLYFEVEVNPFNASEDPSGLYWSPVGEFIDSTGTWTEEPANFNSAAGTASTQKNVVPLDLTSLAVAQVRVKAKETVVGGAAGTVKFVVTTNTIN